MSSFSYDINADYFDWLKKVEIPGSYEPQLVEEVRTYLTNDVITRPPTQDEMDKYLSNTWYIRKLLNDMTFKGFVRRESLVFYLLGKFHYSPELFSSEEKMQQFLSTCLYRTPTIEEVRLLFDTTSSLVNKPKTVEILTFPSLVPGQPDNLMIEKEITSEGGVVELENVARLEIPAGALDGPTRVRIFQVLQVESKLENSLYAAIFLQDLARNVFISPVVRLEPFGLRLNKAALLYLPTDTTRVGINDPVLIQNVASLDAKVNKWWRLPHIKSLETGKISIKGPIEVEAFYYFAKLFSVVNRPDQGTVPIDRTARADQGE